MKADNLSEEELQTMYHARGMSLNEIAEETGVFAYHLWKRMDELGIERRSPEEGQRLKQEREKTEENKQGEEAEADRPDEEEEQERVSDRIYFSPLHYYVEEVMDDVSEPADIPGARVFEL